MISSQVIRSTVLKSSFLNLSLVVSIGLITSLTTPLLASSTDISSFDPPNLNKVEVNSSVVFAQRPVLAPPLADGIYLYGQSPEPEQIGHEYLVFEAREGQIKGAIYMPLSEFNCFSGTLSTQAMRLSLVNPEDDSVWSYSIPVQTQDTVATPEVPSWTTLNLKGFELIHQIGENDQQILNTCHSL